MPIPIIGKTDIHGEKYGVNIKHKQKRQTQCHPPERITLVESKDDIKSNNNDAHDYRELNIT